jgi:hypothetical protein
MCSSHREEKWEEGARDSRFRGAFAQVTDGLGCSFGQAAMHMRPE